MSKQDKNFSLDLEKENVELKKEVKKIEVKETQKFKVVSIVSEKAVMTKGTKDNLLYSKPNKNYKIGQIID